MKLVHQCKYCNSARCYVYTYNIRYYGIKLGHVMQVENDRWIWGYRLRIGDIVKHNPIMSQKFIPPFLRQNLIVLMHISQPGHQLIYCSFKTRNSLLTEIFCDLCQV